MDVTRSVNPNMSLVLSTLKKGISYVSCHFPFLFIWPLILCTILLPLSHTIPLDRPLSIQLHSGLPTHPHWGPYSIQRLFRCHLIPFSEISSPLCTRFQTSTLSFVSHTRLLSSTSCLKITSNHTLFPPLHSLNPNPTHPKPFLTLDSLTFPGLVFNGVSVNLKPVKRLPSKFVLLL